MNFQDIIAALKDYWREQGCLLLQPYDLEIGAGTFAPPTFFGVLGPNPERLGYVQPSRRPSDGRYGENPNRLYQHHQYQLCEHLLIQIIHVNLEAMSLEIQHQKHPLKNHI